MPEHAQTDRYSQLAKALLDRQEPPDGMLDAAMQEIEAYIAGNSLADSFPSVRSNLADLIQETIVRASRSIGLYRGEAKFMTWMLTIARFVVIDHCKDKNNAVLSGEGVSDLMEISSAVSEDPEERAVRKLACAEAIEALDVDEQRSIKMRFTNDGKTSFKDIAVACDTEDAAVRRSVYRGLRKIKQSWDSEGW